MIKLMNTYLPNIRKKYYNKEKLSELDKVMLILNEEDDEKLSKLYEGVNIMEDYVRDAKDASINDDVVGLYDKELHEELLRNTELYNAKESGIREGKLDVARKMLKENISIEVIVKVTGLSRKEIDGLNSAKM